MKIDHHPIPKKAFEIAHAGDPKAAQRMEREWANEILASGEDYCPCKSACIHHGNCFECVQIHRGHRDHLPMCMWDMVNERIEHLAHLTEGSFGAYHAACGEGACPCSDEKG